MKKAWIFAVMTVLLSYGCSPKKETETVREDLNTYSIEYRYWDETSGIAQNIPEFMWKPTGFYPNEYEETTKVSVDDLRHFRKDEDTIYAFEGWYYDVAYTNRVTDNAVATTVRGDITLYAKIEERAKREGDVVTASISYAWYDFKTLKEGISSFPIATVQGLVLPNEYEEGKGISLPSLNTWKQSAKVAYEFESWYYDETLKNKVTEDRISSTQTGNITVYAVFAVWVG